MSRVELLVLRVVLVVVTTGDMRGTKPQHRRGRPVFGATTVVIAPAVMTGLWVLATVFELPTAGGSPRPPNARTRVTRTP